ncbi:Sporulation related domain protein [Tsuneonella dongtanensis]|uniref:Sporulation related domain protein n=1 Tax=Tsuneonella dongtanensis TaxID=692370 RepID=A0A1B2AFL1_9SPHN|nr:SPOR domain-containing protein [Tsuneonella dongtanensis]ANY20943.1 Sporulation related domain protein [Tsuneonella dongtanensis]
MSRSARNTRILTLAAGTALASAMLGGCATQAAPRAEVSAGRADVALKKGKVSTAIAHAEAAVLADPRNAAYRAMLGAAYMEAGRFLSARTSFDDAMALGDETPRTALGYALAAIATGDRGAALEVLDDWRDEIPAADIGLAYALAGQTEMGVHILSNAVRSGDNTPKTRQNLAYALALNGNWAGARIMAAEDVPADQLDARISQWAAMARPEESQNRVAALLGARPVADGGQPAQLALANHPTHEQLVAEANAFASPVEEAVPANDLADASGELPALPADDAGSAQVLAVAPQRVDPPADFQAAFATPAPSGATPAQMMAAAVDFAAQPVVQQTPTRLGAATPAPRRVVDRENRASEILASGDHLVQLGSFSSEAGALRAWGIYAKQFPQLSQFKMVITKAVVRGKTYYRVSAGGLARAEAGSFCSTAKRKGQGCIAWAASRPLPGAVDTGVRMARR